MQKTSDTFVRALENEGVQCVFGIPGEENLDLLDSLRRSKIRFVLTRNEQSAGFMAATFGRLTGKPGVCMATLGPGATNLVTPAAFAQLGGMPMVIITGQKPIKKSKQGRFQIIDVVGMMRPLTKYTKQVVHGHTVTAVIREAFRISSEEKPGAVHIELPEDIARESSDAELYEVTETRRPVPDARTITDALNKIHGAKTPLVIFGARVNSRHVHTAAKQFIEKTGIPFITTQMGKGVVDESSPLYLGTASLSSDDCVHAAIRASDLIINIGYDVVEKPPFIMSRGGVEVIHVNFSPAGVDEVYFPQMEVVGDIAGALAELTGRIEPQPRWDFSEMLSIKRALDESIAVGAGDDSFPIIPPRLVAVVREAMPPDGIISLDNGMYKIWFSRNYRAYQPNTVLLDNALASMGAGLPAAMAARIVYPERKIVAICGDGGFMMNSQELETAVRLKLDVVVMVLNDGAYGMVKWEQKSMKFEPFGLSFNNPDFVKYAESFGAKGHRVQKTQELGGMLDFCLNSKGVHVIDVPVDYSSDSELLRRCVSSLGGKG